MVALLCVPSRVEQGGKQARKKQLPSKSTSKPARGEVAVAESDLNGQGVCGLVMRGRYDEQATSVIKDNVSVRTTEGDLGTVSGCYQ